MSYSTDQVQILERRVRALEDRVLGLKEVKLPAQSCIESLVNCHSRLQSAVAGREKVTSILSKLDELEKCLDPEYADNLTLSEAAKLDIILSEEDNIRKIVDSLQKVEDLNSGLDSEHVKQAPYLTAKLSELHQIQIKQEEQYAVLSADIKALLAAYNSIVSTFTKQFILWDDMLTKLEIAAQPKQIIE